MADAHSHASARPSGCARERAAPSRRPMPEHNCLHIRKGAARTAEATQSGAVAGYTQAQLAQGALIRRTQVGKEAQVGSIHMCQVGGAFEALALQKRGEVAGIA